MTLMVMATRERPARFFAIAAASLALVALFFATMGHELSRALKLIPVGGVVRRHVRIDDPAGRPRPRVRLGGRPDRRAPLGPDDCRVRRRARRSRCVSGLAPPSSDSRIMNEWHCSPAGF